MEPAELKDYLIGLGYTCALTLAFAALLALMPMPAWVPR